jgi:beta-glucosidase
MDKGVVALNKVMVADGAWHELRIPLKCPKDHGAAMGAITRPVVISADAGAQVTLAEARLATDPAGAVCP